MRSRADAGRRPALRLVAIALSLCGAAHLPQAVPAEPPGEAQVRRALERVKADPNLGKASKSRSLQWVESDSGEARPPQSGNFEWLVNLLRFLAETGRWLFWAVVLAIAALSLWQVWSFWQSRRPPSSAPELPPPTHVGELDIRPESLPADIGGAALARLAADDLRGALSLLYRGLLSRLAHRFAARVRVSTTERECLDLARAQLAADGARYAAGVVAAWQGLAYAARRPDAAEVAALCSEFEPALRIR